MSRFLRRQPPPQRTLQDATRRILALVSETLIFVSHPISDVSSGTWLPSVPYSNLASMIDEVVVDDADYGYVTTPGSTFQVKLNTLSDPGVSEGHFVNYRISGPGNVTIYLKQGATTIASWVHTPAPATFTTYTQALSVAEADSITDYADLRIEITAS